MAVVRIAVKDSDPSQTFAKSEDLPQGIAEDMENPIIWNNLGAAKMVEASKFQRSWKNSALKTKGGFKHWKWCFFVGMTPVFC